MDQRGLIDELSREIRDPRVLEAMKAVPRELFVTEELRDRAWDNEPLPIGEGQTISQPLVVASMCELLELTGFELVLDVGTGSGYHAAILSRLADRVISIERHRALSRTAAGSLAAAGIENVTLVVGDGSLGWPDAAPYDAINVAAAGRHGPPQELIEQLADGGRMVIPAGCFDQRMLLVTRNGEEVTVNEGERVRFVPLIEEEP
ncbi:MAG: protein-L-isoaspartate(D-aspartate) O-methyltransferase [Solirubrobacterales bacterium]